MQIDKQAERHREGEALFINVTLNACDKDLVTMNCDQMQTSNKTSIVYPLKRRIIRSQVLIYADQKQICMAVFQTFILPIFTMLYFSNDINDKNK